MALHITVLAADSATETKWAHHLKPMLAEGSLGLASQEEPEAYGQVVFVDAAMPGLESALAKPPRPGRAVFLIAPEGSGASVDQCASLIVAGQADDALVFPFRALEVQSKIRQHQQILMWDEVAKLNVSFSGVIERLQEDLKLAERLQKSKAPIRFPEIKGLKVSSRYLAGLRSGGDHLDLAESRNGNQLSVVLADSSSYGLSSSLLSVLMRVAMKLSSEEVRSCEETVRRIHDELALTLNEKDRLSLFYGVISRKDYRLRYINLGTSCAFYASPGKEFRMLPSQGAPISTGETLPAHPFQEEVVLEPSGRLALISDGFLEAIGGQHQVADVLNRYRGAEAADFLNELVFQLKSGFSDPDDAPVQDSTAVLFDIDSRILRKV